MADQKCHFCKITEPYHYWTKLPPTEHRFLQFMGSNFQTHQKIPQKFADSKMVSEWCSLRGPSTYTWKVRVREGKIKGEKYFYEGWGKFVKDNGVEKSDILVFQCFGFSRFKVHFFDANGCEKEGSHFATNCATMFCNSSLHSSYKDNKYDPKMDVNQEKIPLKHKTEKLEDEDYDYFFRRTTPGNKRQSLKIMLNHPHPHPQTIPKEFAAKNLLKEYHKVKLQVAGAEGSSCIVGCRYNIRSSTSQKTVFQANWKAFVLDNRLKAHDNSLFELIQAGESNGISAIFRVHIYRAGDENLGLSP